MEILGIGTSELVFIIIVALIVLGPKDMQKAGKTIGKFLRNIITSDGWKMFQKTSQELRTLPNRLMREANDDLNQIGNELNNAVNPAIQQGEQKMYRKESGPDNPSRSQPVPTTLPENKIAPTVVETKSNESEEQKDA